MLDQTSKTTDRVTLFCDSCGKKFTISESAWQGLAPDYYEDGMKIKCDRCNEHDNYKPHAPGTAPDTSLHLGDERKEWLRQQGGIQPTIIRLIDEAMGK